MSEKIEGALEFIVSKLETMERKLDMVSAPPRLLKLEEAARLLSCSKTKLKELVRRGVIGSTLETGRRMVPITEIIRLTAVTVKPVGAPDVPPRRAPTASLEAEAAALRALLRKRR